MICRDGSVVAASQTAPTKAYQPPLQMLFVVVIVGGDFNIIIYIKEKNTMDGVHRYSQLFNSVIQFYELRELVMTGGLFTWSNNQEFPILEKLDRLS